MNPILQGISGGNQIGCPTELAKIVCESVSCCGSADVRDLTTRYLSWANAGAFDTGPTYKLDFDRISKGLDIQDAVEEVDILLEGMTAG